MQALHDEARRLGVRHLELTSRPSRTAANALYVSLGYERRETNVYRLTF
jgi:ribosomal protein S18 acetylase RimI-like enzyme